MDPKVIWLFAFVALFWGFCIYWGIRGARTARTASDYFLAGRNIPTWVFVLAATASSFSGWTFMGHPALIFRDGFQYAFASFYTIAIPLAGVMFLKRQWMLGKRFGYVSPGEMYGDYFQGSGIRVLGVIVAILFTVPFIGIQFRASGYLFNVLTDGLLPVEAGIFLLAFALMVYVAFGGMKAVAYVDSIQCILLTVGIVMTGAIAWYFIGGLEGLSESLAALAQSDLGLWGRTQGEGGGDYNGYFAVPGAIQWTAGLGEEDPVGGPWTGTMMLSYMFALCGIMTAPAFTMWAFGNSNPKPFAPQQVWASAFGLGLILIFLTAIMGVAAQFLGADPNVTAAVLAKREVLPVVPTNLETSLIPHYVNLLADEAPWLVAFLAVCAVAAMQSTGGAFLSTAGAMLTRDLYKEFISPNAGHTIQKFFGRMSIVALIIASTITALVTDDALVLIGGVAVAFGAQMIPALTAICWVPWFTRQGVTLGLAAGLLMVFLTENIGIHLIELTGLDLPWGRWPLTIHSAGWGILVNLFVCITVSALTQDTDCKAHRLRFHKFLGAHTRLPQQKRNLRPLAWVATIGWIFFAFGPGSVVGNDLFGAPDAGLEGWTFGIPSIWAWQILWWGLGVLLIWFLAYWMEMSVVPEREITAIAEDIGDRKLIKDKG